MKIAVIGTGYVGLVSGACFAETGIDVVCVDNNIQKIQDLQVGLIPIYEPGLEEIVKRNLEKGRLSFTTSLQESLIDCEAIFIAVGTPPAEDGSADLEFVYSVAKEIGQYLNNYIVVITKSTVPVGTSMKVKQVILDELNRRDVAIPFDVASNPEFLKEGNAIEDFLKPDRIVVGIENEQAEKVMRKLYKPFLLNGHPILFGDIASSEMTKYAANSMLATKISFMNDIANLCELVGANVDFVRKGIGSDPRIGNKFIYPGTGYGGACFPKDVKALIRTGENCGYSLDILKAVESVNLRQKTVLVKKILFHFNNNIEGKKIAIWGLTYKPKTDDIREAPSLKIIEQLLSERALISVYDPVAMVEGEKVFGNRVKFAKDQYDACIDADALVLVTEWPEFRMPNFNVLSKLLKNKLIFDGRNIYEPEEMADLQFNYYSIGRETIISSSTPQ